MNIRIIKETRSFCHLGDREWAREKPDGPKDDLRGVAKILVRKSGCAHTWALVRFLPGTTCVRQKTHVLWFRM